MLLSVERILTVASRIVDTPEHGLLSYPHPGILHYVQYAVQFMPPP